MTEKYLGSEHYFTQKFKRRKSFVGTAAVYEAQMQTAYGLEIETPDPEDYMYYQSMPPYQYQQEGTWNECLNFRGRSRYTFKAIPEVNQT